MNSDSNSKQINIYLSDADKTEMNKKAVESTENMSQQYIILSHDKMRIANEQLSEELAELQRKCDELEEDNERMEKTVMNLKGFVKNIGEINKLNIQLKKTYAKFQNESRNLIVDNYNTIYKLLCDKAASMCIIFIVYVILWFMNCVSFVDVVLSVTLDAVLIMFTFRSFCNECSYVKDIRYAPDIKDTKYHAIHHKYASVISEKMSALAEIEKGNEFINDLIDMQ